MTMQEKTGVNLFISSIVEVVVMFYLQSSQKKNPYRSSKSHNPQTPKQCSANLSCTICLSNAILKRIIHVHPARCNSCLARRGRSDASLNFFLINKNT